MSYDTSLERVTVGHPVKEGTGYDCHCGECLALRQDGRLELESQP